MSDTTVLVLEIILLALLCFNVVYYAIGIFLKIMERR